jgi:hypothetical protein
LGVKPITVRLAFSNKRLSKKMVSMLESMETEIIRKEEDEEISELIASVSEVPVLDDVRTAKVYLLPKNPYLRFIEFSDGTHGKFRAKPGRFGLGSVVKVKRESGDMYTLEGKYDGRDRLV